VQYSSRTHESDPSVILEGWGGHAEEKPSKVKAVTKRNRASPTENPDDKSFGVPSFGANKKPKTHKRLRQRGKWIVLTRAGLEVLNIQSSSIVEEKTGVSRAEQVPVGDHFTCDLGSRLERSDRA